PPLTHSPSLFHTTATTHLYTLSLHDALPISLAVADDRADVKALARIFLALDVPLRLDLADHAHVEAFLLLLGQNLQHRVVADLRSEEHTSELQSRFDLVCRLLLEKKKITYTC